MQEGRIIPGPGEIVIELPTTTRRCGPNYKPPTFDKDINMFVGGVEHYIYINPFEPFSIEREEGERLVAIYADAGAKIVQGMRPTMVPHDNELIDSLPNGVILESEEPINEMARQRAAREEIGLRARNAAGIIPDTAPRGRGRPRQHG